MILSSTWTVCTVFLGFFIASLPLVKQDSAEGEVHVLKLLLPGFVLLWLTAWLQPRDLTGHLVGTTALLGAGTLFMVLLREKLGEADVVYASFFGLLFPFFSVLAALAWACLAAFALYAWMTLRRSQPEGIAFTPCLLWGALAEFSVRGWGT